jgi:hypothetical protein
MPDETTWSVWWAFIRHPFKKGTIARVINRYGVYSTALRCSTCGNRVWVTPDIENGSKSWQSCLADDCPSYDPHRDVSFLMSAEKE